MNFRGTGSPRSHPKKALRRRWLPAPVVQTLRAARVPNFPQAARTAAEVPGSRESGSRSPQAECQRSMEAGRWPVMTPQRRKTEAAKRDQKMPDISIAPQATSPRYRRYGPQPAADPKERGIDGPQAGLLLRVWNQARSATEAAIPLEKPSIPKARWVLPNPTAMSADRIPSAKRPMQTQPLPESHVPILGLEIPEPLGRSPEESGESRAVLGECFPGPTERPSPVRPKVIHQLQMLLFGGLTVAKDPAWNPSWHP